MNVGTFPISMVALAILLVACEPAREQDAAARDTTADTMRSGGAVRETTITLPPPLGEDPVPLDTVARPSKRRDTLMLEGDPHPFEATRVDAALYTIYYPADDMVVEQSASDEGEGLRFIARFGGVRNDSAFLHIFTPNDPKAGPDSARRLLLDQYGIVRSNGWTAEETTSPWYAWALESYALRGRRGSSLIGRAMVGEHRGRGVVVVTVYPEEYAEGMGPRVEKILSSLEWRDTRTGLAREEAVNRKLE